MTKETPDRACAAFAATNHGVVPRRQALELGMTPRMIAYRIKAGDWLVLYPGIYIPSIVPVAWLSRLAGAVLGAGPKAAASHRSAGRLIGLDGFEHQIVEITSTRRLRWPRVVNHEVAEYPVRELTRVKNIVTTTATRVLLEVGAVVDLAHLEAAIDSALLMGLTSIPYLERRLAECGERGRRGITPLRRLLASRAPGQAPTESELERKFDRNVVRRFDLARPRFQFRPRTTGNDDYRIDFAYPELMLGIEVLGWRFHLGRRAWQRDLTRHNQLANLGWHILYFTWSDVVDRPSVVAEAVRVALNQRSQPSFVI